jgi:hypothetical protein
VSSDVVLVVMRPLSFRHVPRGARITLPYHDMIG